MVSIVYDIISRSDIEDLLNFVKYFWHQNGYSVFNSILIYAQRPGAVMLATERYWNTVYRRKIKHESTPIVIMKPFGPVEFIYDYSDTYGEKDLFPCRLTHTDSFDIQEWWTGDLIESLMHTGILYTESNFGTRRGADICILDEPRSYRYITNSRNEKVIKTDCCITVNSMSDNGAKFTAILHELGHLFCGHLKRGSYTPKNIKFSNRVNEKLTENQREHEAEITKNIVCKILGIKLLNTCNYLQSYKNKDGNTPLINYNEIIKAVDKILNIIPQSIKEFSNDSFHQYTFF